MRPCEALVLELFACFLDNGSDAAAAFERCPIALT